MNRERQTSRKGIEDMVTEKMRAASAGVHELARKSVEIAEHPVAGVIGLAKTKMRKEADHSTEEMIQRDREVGERIAAEAKRLAQRALDASESSMDAFIEETDSTGLTRRGFLAGIVATFGLGVRASQEEIGERSESEEEDVGIYEEEIHTEHSLYAWEVSKELRERYPWLEHVAPHEFYDGRTGIEWRRYVKGGRFSPEERAGRAAVLAGGERIFHDIGLDFYTISPGDNRANIQDKLARYPQYAYLKDINPLERIEGFNIGALDLRAGDPLPIPSRPEERRLEDAQLLKYIVLAIEDIVENGPTLYKDRVRDFIDRHGEQQLLLSAFAVGRHEAGTQYPGEYVLHRHEKRYNSYSYSHFHILMRDWGLTARKKLGITEGQMMHPVNGAKVFIRFLIEKDSAWNALPITDDTVVDFARAYNGSAHRKNEYTQRIEAYLESGERVIDSLSKLSERDSSKVKSRE